MTYFDRDAKFVAAAAREDPRVFLRAVLMVLLSIRQPWLRVPKEFEKVLKEGESSTALFGFKRDGYTYAKENLDHLHGTVKNYEGNLDSILQEFLNIPGLGLAKASFLAQLTVNDGACLDSHNLRMIGKTAEFLRLDKKSRAVVDRVSEYNKTWQAYGDSAYWWNTWCEHMAERYKTTGSEISAIHRLPVL